MSTNIFAWAGTVGDIMDDRADLGFVTGENFNCDNSFLKVTYITSVLLIGATPKRSKQDKMRIKLSINLITLNFMYFKLSSSSYWIYQHILSCQLLNFHNC